ncbi:type VII secretion target [Paractinoplanes brasiliensis]|uniref:Excreted virulence factor EspC (Type VII ESX diderm) n=1 Tax=Paractinoplanes brasiliensis TaxID=52695 RepID=A0A4R6JRI1_9ACTN|nr:hypothetical protein [Actinoplanes brasiliensis]TDO39160.1 excreted virulence factor EspC (type VII ESX diderm) [Actinoplanes brasiliensis]GID30139.1 hypothetical protein Abr02nite_51220 [Actinoplanes brasiliensis]
MDTLAESLDQAADSLTALSREVPGLAAASSAFAAPPVGAGVSAVPPDGRALGTETGVTNAGRGTRWDAGEGLGLPGRVSRSLQDRWAAALEARTHEAAAAAARLTTLADSVRTTRQAYTETDEAVRRRFTRET